MGDTTYTTYATTTVFIYVIGLLALILIIVYFYNEYKAIRAKDAEKQQDTYYAPCPDYWENVGKSKCQNVFGIGKCAVKDNTLVDFDDTVFNNKISGNYAKCKWAKGCGISWNNIERLC